jgi:hypothetical protein
MNKQLKLICCLLVFFILNKNTTAQYLINKGEFFIDKDLGIHNGSQFAIVPGDSTNVSINFSISNNLAIGNHKLYSRTFANKADYVYYSYVLDSNYNITQVEHRISFPEKVGATYVADFYVQGKYVKAEYFFDTDPGFGNGIAMLVPNNYDSIDTSWAISIPANMKNGVHNLYVRTLVDNGYGFDTKWSQTNMMQVNVFAEISKAEFFIDTDPGQGNGINIPFTPSGDSVNISSGIVIPTTIAAGNHKLYVRTFTAGGFNNGQWSLPDVQAIKIAQKITAAEYFFDTDPGFGNATATTTSMSSDSVAITENIMVPPLLKTGLHKLYLRTKVTNGIGSTGQWSITESQTIYVQNNITLAEYFFDTDPGFGNATAIVITTPGDSITQANNISVAGIASGMHNLYLRSRTADGIWSNTQSQSIYIQPKIIAYQYWIDSIPQPISNNYILLSQAADSINFNASITMPCNLLAGNHNLYISTLSDVGIWSIPQSSAFISTVSPLFSIAVSANMNPIGIGQNLIVTATASAANSFAWAGPIQSSSTNVLNTIVSLADNGVYTVTASNAAGCTAANTINITVLNGIKLALKVILSGPFNTTNNLMNDDLRSNNMIPNMQPYGIAPYNIAYNLVGSGTETIGANVLNTIGSNAIVDWVFVQLRSKLDSTIIVQTKSALLQRDGDIVEASDGMSPIYFSNVNPDYYFVSIKHRNHSGVMASVKVQANFTPTVLDFTDVNLPLYLRNGSVSNAAPLTGATRIQNGKRTLYAGNCLVTTLQTAKIITYNNTVLSDRAAMLTATGGTATLNGYSVFDLDLNGYARFNGLNPDRVVMLNNCLGSTSIIINEQTPN